MKCRSVAAFGVFMAGCAFAQPAVLTTGTPLERAIEPGQNHVYRIAVATGQFVHVSADQLGADLVLQLNRPASGKFTHVDRVPYYEAFEDVFWIATESGEASVEVRTSKKSKAGAYRLNLELRTPTEADRHNAAGFSAAWIEAQDLRTKQKESDLRQAAALLESAAGAFRAAGNARWEAYALSERAQILYGFGQYAAARDVLEQTLVLRRELGERFSLSVTLNGLGLMNNALGDNQKAILYYDQVLAMRREAGDRQGEAGVLNNLGGLYKNISEFPKAIEAYQRSIELRREAGDRSGEARAISGLGSVYFSAGDYQAALETYSDSWRLRTVLGNKRDEASTAMVLGNTYYLLGNRREARQYWALAEPIYRETGYAQGLGTLLYGMGVERVSDGDYAGGMKYYGEALALHRKTAMAVPMANLLTGMCQCLVTVGRTAEARAHAEESLEISRKAGYKVGIGSATECLGRIDLAAGDVRAARFRFRDALEIFRGTGSRENQVITLVNLASTDQKAGEFATGLKHIEQAMALVESARSSVNDPALRAYYRAARANRVDLHTDLLMTLHGGNPASGFGERAFNVTERWRARSLAEMIQDSRTELRQELTPEERTREDRLLSRIAVIQRDLFREGPPSARLDEAKRKLAAAETELDLFQANLRRGGNHYAEAQYAEVWDAERIREKLLDPRTALIEYALGEKQSYAWAITSSGIVAAVLPPREEIERHVGAYRKLLAEPVSALTASQAIRRVDVEGRKLYEFLVAPLESQLAKQKRLILVPDGILAYLPFEALPGPGRLIERFSISYAPSASALAALRGRDALRSAPPQSLLAFADPTLKNTAAPDSARDRSLAFASLPNARQEVAGIRALFAPAASRVFMGDDAHEQKVKSETSGQYRYIHFAAHGYFDEEQPLRSGLVLGPGADPQNDGFLQAPEIMRLRLNADVVTLSACQTGLGKVLAGEGVLGLTRAFFYAGAQSLVVSLWNVNDAATAELMQRFYTGLKAGMARDEALRRAKLSLMKTAGPWRHPYFWAPFVFVGDAGSAATPPLVRASR